MIALVGVGYNDVLLEGKSSVAKIVVAIRDREVRNASVGEEKGVIDRPIPPCQDIQEAHEEAAHSKDILGEETFPVTVCYAFTGRGVGRDMRSIQCTSAVLKVWGILGLQADFKRRM